MKRIIVTVLVALAFVCAFAQNSFDRWVPASGTNTYSTNITGHPGSYSNTQPYIKFANSNTTAATLSINGMAAQPLRMWDGDSWEPLTSGFIDVNTVYRISYGGSFYQIESSKAALDFKHSINENYVASGTGTYTVSVTPSFTSYNAGDWWVLRFTSSNTGASTLNINSIGAASLKKNVTEALVQGDIEAGVAYVVSYDGTNFQLIGGRKSKVVYPEQFGANGDDALGDGDAFNTAFTVAGTKGEVRLASNKTYIIDKKVTLLVSSRLIGDGTPIVKRQDATTTTLTAQANSGVTSITVASTTGFSVGDEFVAVDATLPNGGRGYLENSAATFGTSPQVITSIVGNTINFTTAFSQTIPNGSVVVRLYDMFIGQQSTVTVAGLGNVIQGIEFDGNRTNNNHTNSWTFNKTIDDLPSKTLVANCTFHDAPGENIFISNQTTVRDCHFYDMNGSMTHVSQASSPNEGSNIFTGNKGRNICLATNEVTGHSEGAFTFSASPGSVIISNNEVRTCSEAFISPMSHLSPYLEVHSNKVFTSDGAILVTNFDVTNTTISKHCSIKNNTFSNCGWLKGEVLISLTSTQKVEKNLANDHITISGNEFVNTKLMFDRISGLTISDNRFITESTHTYSSTDAASGRNAHISLTRCTQYSISDNTFDNRATSLDTRLTTAINCEYDFNLNLALSQPVKSNSSTSTEYCYHNRNVKIADNKIHNYNIGIVDYYAASEILPARSLSWIGFEISNNLITLRTSGSYGIVAGPGTVVNDNKIYSTSSSVAGIVALGVNDGTGSTYNNGGTQKNRLNGAIVYNNTIVGAGLSIQVGSTNATFGNNIYNCMVYENFIDGTITDNTSGFSSILKNRRTVCDEALILQIVRQNPSDY